MAVDHPFVTIEAGGCADGSPTEQSEVLDIGTTLRFSHGIGCKYCPVRIAEHGGKLGDEPLVDIRFNRYHKQGPIGHSQRNGKTGIRPAHFLTDHIAGPEKIIGLSKAHPAVFHGE